MRISKLLGPVFFALAMAAAAGCATESDDDTNGSEDAITGSVQQARLQRIKQAYIDAKIEDFTEIQPLMTAEQLQAWNVGVQDPHWFSFQVDGRAVYMVDFLGDANALLTGAAPVLGGPTEEFVVLFDATGAGDTASYGAVLLYRADTNEWGGLTRVLKDAKPSTADAGVPVPDGGTHSADGGSPHADGGTSHTDGGTPHADGGTSHTDGGVPHADGGAIVDAGPG